MKKTISLLMSLIILTGALIVFPSTITASAKAYKYVTTTKTYKIDGKVTFKVKLKRAKLTAKTKGAKKVNRFLSKQQTKLKNKYWKWAKQAYYRGADNFPHNYNSTITLTYNKSKKYSFKMLDSGYTGGAHGWSMVKGYTFKKSTGKKISALSVVSNRSKFLKNVKKAFKNKYGADTYEWLNLDNTKLGNYKYFLKGKYVYAAYNLGSVIFPYGLVKVKPC